MSIDNPAIQDDILSDSDIRLVEASTGQRFGNWIIDNLFMRFALSYATGILIGMILQAVAPEVLNGIVEGRRFDYYLVLILVGYLNYIVYYTICEKLFQGKTLGKLITGTKAIREDGQPLTFKDAILRSLVRIVPFEVFSGFGVPWHDSWTRTTVVRAR